MSKQAFPAAAEGMPNFSRRRMLIGLAAASTAAATATVDAAVSPSENPRLLALADELPGIAAAYHFAHRAQKKAEKYWKMQVWAPDELTVPGTAWPHDDPRQPGDPELTVIGDYLWRVGDQYPRRIVVRSWAVYAEIITARRELRKARKEGRLADCLALEEEIARLKKLKRVASEYERKHRETRKKADEDLGKLWPVTHARRDELEDHVAAIMKEPDYTMEGLVIKAQALAEWDKLKGANKLAFRHGQNWHGQIAAAILRHAKGGAA